MLIEAVGENGSSSIIMASFPPRGFTMTFFSSGNFIMTSFFSREIYCDFLFSKELQCDFLFSKECDFFVNPVLDNIPENPARISTMIPGVVILTVDFSSKLIFAKELVILRKSDELLLHNEFLSLCHIGCIPGSFIRGL